MDGLRIALLLVGVLNLVLLGAVACGGKEAPGTSDDLTLRVVRLEAWRLLQERVTQDQVAGLSDQHDLNQQFRAAFAAAQEHARSVDRSLEQQGRALELANQVLQDLLRKLK